jgi:aryl-alcohol dehydrogenase-like predicted oxidoreductase
LIPRTPVLQVDEEEARREIERALGALRDLARERGAELTVVVLPWLREREHWPTNLPGKHAHVVGLLETLGIRHFAFLDELDQAIAEGEEVKEKPMDPQHPSAAFGARMARGMLARGFVP